MRINRIEELGKIYTEIKDKNAGDFEKEICSNQMILRTAIDRMIELNNIARLEGLLALEETAENIPLESMEGELKQLLMLIVDGTEPEVLRGIGLTRYYANLYTDYQALKHFIYLEGALSIQAGDNPRVMEEKLKSLLPGDMYLEYSLEQKREFDEKEKVKKDKLIEKLCKGKRLWNPGENGYYVSKLLDYVICNMPDKGMQRTLREVDNRTLALAMKGMSGEARKHIFSNLSERMGKMIAEDMTYMGLVRIVDILDASQKVLTTIINLIDACEIVGEFEYLEPFFNVFSVDTASQYQKLGKISQLKEMVDEYEQSAGLVREADDEAQ